jgi:hypothetical protein
MQHNLKGSTPGLITRNSSGLAGSIPVPPQVHISDSISTFSLKTTVSEKDDKEEWMSSDELEKDRVSERDFPSKFEKDVQQENVASVAPKRPDIERQESYWQAGPPAASLYSAGDEIAYPEGGLQGWLVVFGSFCGMLSSFGFMNSSTCCLKSGSEQRANHLQSEFSKAISALIS